MASFSVVRVCCFLVNKETEIQLHCCCCRLLLPPFLCQITHMRENEKQNKRMLNYIHKKRSAFASEIVEVDDFFLQNRILGQHIFLGVFAHLSSWQIDQNISYLEIPNVKSSIWLPWNGYCSSILTKVHKILLFCVVSSFNYK